MILDSVERVVSLFETWGLDNYDEEITQLDHALQTAAHARVAGSTDELIAAALLHDIGHLIDLEAGGTVAAPISNQHDVIGAAALTPLFSPAVTGPIALHVRAKRYLACVEPQYLAALSAGSLASLAHQGGPMAQAEARQFESTVGFAPACALRRWDDLGKVDGIDVPDLSSYLELLMRSAHTH